MRNTPPPTQLAMIMHVVSQVELEIGDEGAAVGDGVGATIGAGVFDCTNTSPIVISFSLMLTLYSSESTMTNCLMTAVMSCNCVRYVCVSSALSVITVNST